MRSELPLPAQARFLPLLHDEAAWKSLASYGARSGDDAYVLVLDADGEVKWRAHGAVDADAYASFKASLDAARNSSTHSGD
jgi:hypothetical protein